MDVECPQPCPEDTIAVLILTDGFPEETTWEITLQPTNEVVASGGPYTGMPNTLIETEVCVDADGCYDVTIFDSAGNGITPPGGYQIDFNGATVAAGPGNFGASLTIPDVGGGCPTGACCLPDGNCLEAVTDSQCSAASGTYVGNDILCANANCPQPPVAACCLPDGQCIDEDQFTCADMNGEYQGDGTACTTTSCPIPCPDATIKVLILTDAAPKQTTWEVREQGSGTVVGSGGPYAEPGTLFETDVCVSSTSCYDFTIFDSAGNGIFPGGYQVSYNGTIVGASGNFTGASATVANIGDNCMGLAMGACCFSDQSCLQLTQPGCLLSAGSFQGNGTLCADNPCAAAPCDGDTNNDGVVDVTDLINVISTWGTDGQGPGFDADLNDDGTVDVTDLIEVISGWGDCV